MSLQRRERRRCRVGAGHDSTRHVARLPWPVAGDAEDGPFEVPTTSGWGTFLHVQRGHGSTSTRATGTLTVERTHPSGGTLHLDVATENDGDLHGSVRGAMPFVICSG